MPSEVEIAWAAGLFEGEGCISSNAAAMTNLKLSLSSTDRDVVEHFHSIVGVGHICMPALLYTGKPIHRWHLCHGAQIVSLMEKFWPYLHERRRARYIELQAVRDEFIAQRSAPRTCPECGQEFIPRSPTSGGKRIWCSVRCGQNFRYKASRPTTGAVVDSPV